MKAFITSLFGTIFLLSAAVGQYQMEDIDRAVVAVKKPTGMYIGWRLLVTDVDTIAFNVYRGDTKLNAEPLTESTNYLDTLGTISDSYHVFSVLGGVEQTSSDTVGVWNTNYLSVPLQRPAGGTTQSGDYTYNANDCSVGDLDGDGKYEIVLKWDPSNSKDNSQDGHTGNCILDAYEMDGTLLWRIDLGVNIRAGAHYTQFMVYDLDGDGIAELACKTAPGSKDATGNYLSLGPANGADHTADYRNSAGYILSGPEYFTIFDGQTGNELATTDYLPARGNVNSWGDNYGNRVDRFLAAVAYLDGSRPSVVMCRGYYTRTVLAAWDWRDGTLTSRWIFDSNVGYPTYAGQGNHGISVADVDEDGKDEIIYGAMAVDDDGTGLWNADLGHGDAMHVSDIDPLRPGLEKWGIHEDASKPHGSALLDARTGEVIWGTAPGDIGRGASANLKDGLMGMECWGGTDGLRTSTNEYAGSSPSSANHVVWWDGDLSRELLNGTEVRKYAGGVLVNASNCSSNNGSKSNPALQADLFGDWREEVIWRTSNNLALRIYTTSIVTPYRLTTFMHDPVYRLGVAWQNVAYNQPPHTSFFVGELMFVPDSLWPPSAPRNLYSEDLNKKVRLFWDHNIDLDLAGYNLYRSKEEAGPFSVINDSLLIEEFYLDTTVYNDSSYYYYVTAVDTNANESKPSNKILSRPTTRPDYPTGVYTRSDSVANLIVWNEVDEEDIAGYFIYRSSTSGTGYAKLNEEAITDTVYLDSPIDIGSTNYYSVRSVNDIDVESFYSDEVSATPGNTYTTQAEDEVMGGTVYLENNHVGYKGNGFVNFDATASSVTFNNMPGFGGGEYSLLYRYAFESGSRTGALIVNDNTQSLTMASTGAWTNWDTDTVFIDLDAGFSNTIRFESTGADFGNLDQITIKQIVIPEPEGNTLFRLDGSSNKLNAMPNPFNENVVLHFSIDEPATVSVLIYNSQGQLINNMSHSAYEIGSHSVEWNGRNQGGELVPTGVYYCRVISSSNYHASIKLLFVGR